MHGTIDQTGDDHLREAREKANAMPLADFDPANPELFRSDTHWPYFDRLRKEDPVHYCKDSMFGPYWSVTKYNDIMAVDTNHGVFSSAAALGGITVRDAPKELIEAADLVTEMTEVKHPFQAGIRAQKGIEF